jgi:hypothetical protein
MASIAPSPFLYLNMSDAAAPCPRWTLYALPDQHAPSGPKVPRKIDPRKGLSEARASRNLTAPPGGERTPER